MLNNNTFLDIKLVDSLNILLEKREVNVSAIK